MLIVQKITILTIKLNVSLDVGEKKTPKTYIHQAMPQLAKIVLTSANQTTKWLRNQGRTKGESWSTAN